MPVPVGTGKLSGHHCYWKQKECKYEINLCNLIKVCLPTYLFFILNAQIYSLKGLEVLVHMDQQDSGLVENF